MFSSVGLLRSSSAFIPIQQHQLGGIVVAAATTYNAERTLYTDRYSTTATTVPCVDYEA